MTLAIIVAGPDWGTLIVFAALGLGTGLGAGLVMRAASKPFAQTPSEVPSQGDIKHALQAVTNLFIVAIGFGLVGFVCGAIASALLLSVLMALRFPGGVVADTLAGLVTGLIAGALAGYLVERVGERFQLTTNEARGAMLRSAVVAGAVGAVGGLLAGGLAGHPAAGLILSTLGVAALAAVVGGGVATGVRVARPEAGGLLADVSDDT